MMNTKEYQDVLAYVFKYQSPDEIDSRDFRLKFNKYKHDVIRQAIRDRFIAKYIVNVTFLKTGDIVFDKKPHTNGITQEEIKEQFKAIMIGALADKKDQIISENDGSDILKIEPVTRDFLMGLVSTIDDFSDAMSIVKTAIREVLSLDTRDIILTRSGDIFIKKYCRVGEVQNKPDSMSIDLQTYFADKGLSNLIDTVMGDLLDSEFSFLRCTPTHFQTNFLPRFLSTSTMFLVDDMGEKFETAEKVAKEVVRTQANKIMRMAAERLLLLVGNGEKIAERFLYYYDGSVEIVDGVQYVRPRLEDANKSTVSPAVVKSILMQYKKGEEKRLLSIKERDMQEKAMIDLQKSIAEYEKLLETNKEEEVEILKNIKKAKITLEDYENNNMSAKKNDRDSFMKDRKIFIQEEEDMQIQLQNCKNERDRLTARLKDSKHHYDGAKRKYEKAVSDVDGFTSVLREPRQKYELFVSVVMRALWAKRIKKSANAA